MRANPNTCVTTVRMPIDEHRGLAKLKRITKSATKSEAIRLAVREALEHRVPTVAEGAKRG
jgi:hypothetical protein